MTDFLLICLSQNADFFCIYLIKKTSEMTALLPLKIIIRNIFQIYLASLFISLLFRNQILKSDFVVAHHKLVNKMKM
jgi:hypothetical protein